MSRAHPLIPALAVLLLQAPLASAEAPRAVESRIRTLVEAYSDAGHFTGCALVARGDRVLYSGALGLANREWAIPHQADSRFLIGSLSKAITATVVLQLVHEGKLSLGTSLAESLAPFPRARGERITLRHLLTHTSGLRSHGDAPGFETRLERLPRGQAEVVEWIAGLDPRFGPGERFSYSSFGYDLLAFVCERSEGRPFGEILRQRVFAPAGMVRTSLADFRALDDHRAAGYEYDLVPGFQNATFFDASNVVGSGGVLSTVGDLHRFVRALSRDGLLPAALRAEMLRSQVAAGEGEASQVTPGAETAGGAGYGYGWFVSATPAGDRTRVWHTGSTNGFTALLSWVRDTDEIVVLLSNVRSNLLAGDRRYKLASLEQEIRRVLAGKAGVSPLRSAAMAVAPVAVSRGGAAAVEAYRRLSRSRRQGHYFDEMELNALGLELFFKLGRAEDAQALLTFNIEEHPRSYNVYDSLAYVLQRMGRAEEALACYRRGIAVFEADPAANAAYRADYEKALKRVAAMQRPPSP